MSYLRSRPDLLRGFRDGDRDALAEVYRAYLPLVKQAAQRGFVIKSSGARVPGASNPDDLADIIQDVFSGAFKRAARLAYDGTRDYAPYLAIVTRNAVVSQHRRRGRELLTVDLAVVAESDLIEVEHEPAEPWLDARSVAVARAYVSTLAGPMRAVHAARYVDAMSQRDAAKELGLSRSKLRKIEDKLRRELLHVLTRAGVRRDEPIAIAVPPDTQPEPWTRRPRTN
jgi:RNA polymerase sigma factor (sigma-70 family)